MNLSTLRVVQEARHIVTQGVLGACIGAAIGLFGKSNVVLATSIVAARNIAQAVTNVVTDRLIGLDTRAGALVSSFSNMFIATVAIAALKKFDIIGNRFAAVGGGIILGVFAYQLILAFKIQPALNQQ
jgi:hypothetical protein